MNLKEINVIKLFIYMYSLIQISMKWTLTQRKIKRFIVINAHDLRTVKTSHQFISSLIMTYVKYIRYTVTVGKTVSSLLNLLPMNIGNIITKIGGAFTKDYIATMQNAEPACAYHLTEYFSYHLQVYKEDKSLFIQTVMICIGFFPSETMNNIYKDILQYTNVEKSEKDQEFLKKFSVLFSKSLKSEPKNEDCPRGFKNISMLKKSNSVVSSYVSSFKRENICVDLNQLVVIEKNVNQKLKYVKDIAKSGEAYHVYQTEKYVYRILADKFKSNESTNDSTSAESLLNNVDKLHNPTPQINQQYTDVIRNSEYPWWYSSKNKYQYVYFSSSKRSNMKNIHKIRLQSVGNESQAILLSQSDNYKNTTRVFTDIQFNTLLHDNGFPAGIIEIENPSVLSNDINKNLTYYIINIPYSLPYMFIMFIVMWRAKEVYPIEKEFLDDSINQIEQTVNLNN